MAYWRLCYHFVWTTKNRESLITPQLEGPIYRWLHNEAKKLYCPYCYIGGIDDHVHLLAAVRPSIAPAEFMHQLKGSSSRFVTLEFGIPFSWQEGYGVFSVSESVVDTVKGYILRQKEHHAAQSIIDTWEETHEWNLGPAAIDDDTDLSHHSQVAVAAPEGASRC